MTWEPRPVPHVAPEAERFWEAATAGEFLLRRCEDCDLVFYYPRGLCPDCLSENVEWIESTGQGEVYSYSSATSVSGWPEEHLPLILAYVELDEGPRVMTNLIADPEDIEIGGRVEAEFVETEQENVAIPVFSPIE